MTYIDAFITLSRRNQTDWYIILVFWFLDDLLSGKDCHNDRYITCGLWCPNDQRELISQTTLPYKKRE